MGKIDHYRVAPTFLYNDKGKSKLFQTQDEVDKAWNEGWFGPPWLLVTTPLISKREFETKKDLIMAVNEDPRYASLSLNAKRSIPELLEKIVEFETEHGLSETRVEE